MRSVSANSILRLRMQTPHPALRATFSHKGRREAAVDWPIGALPMLRRNHLTWPKEFAMLDFTSDVAADGLSGREVKLPSTTRRCWTPIPTP